MVGFDDLPTEVLAQIVSYLSDDIESLRESTKVGPPLSEIASAALYKNIDLNIIEWDDDVSNEKSRKRQRRLFDSIAKNPRIGALVKTFKNSPYAEHGAVATMGYERDPATWVAQHGDSSDYTKLLETMASNMKNLSLAFLTPNPLTARIISDLQSYQHLLNLHVTGLKPGNFIWRNSPVSLTHLTWAIALEPGYSGEENEEINIFQLLLNVAASTCPSLISLDISFDQNIDGVWEEPPRSETQERVKQYLSTTSSRLPNLRHFGILDLAWDTDPALSSQILDFVREHPQLTSISFTTNRKFSDRERVEYTIQVCEMLPHLKVLKLMSPLDGLDFWTALAPRLASPNYEIERLEVSNIGCAYSQSLGQLFRSWKSLKFLRLGEESNVWGEGGRFGVRHCKAAIVRFIEELPQSLEMLYLEIWGEELFFDQDSDFDPFTCLGPTVFKALRRLHTFDIHAWISNLDGGLGSFPEKGVFYRRLPYQPNLSTKTREAYDAGPDAESDSESDDDAESHGTDEPMDNTSIGSPDDGPAPNNIVVTKKDTHEPRTSTRRLLKDIWIARMECIYQTNDADVSKWLATVEADFEGDDAEEEWCGGLTCEGEHGLAKELSRMNNSGEPDYSWPFWRNPVAKNPMYRNRQ